MLKRTPPDELYFAFPESTEMDERESHPRNTLFPRVFTEAGSVTEARPGH